MYMMMMPTQPVMYAGMFEQLHHRLRYIHTHMEHGVVMMQITGMNAQMLLVQIRQEV